MLLLLGVGADTIQSHLCRSFEGTSHILLSFACDLCDVHGTGTPELSSGNGFMCLFWPLLFLHSVIESGKPSALLQ